MFTRYFLSSRIRPWPWQVWQGCSITVPEPPQRSHGRVIEKQPLALRLHAAAVADGADDGLGARLGARAAARRAGRVRGHGDRDLRALDRLVEGERDRRLEIAPALRGRPRARAAPAAALVEDPREDVGERAEVGARGAAGGAAGAARERVHPAAVVPLALLRVRQDVVGLGDLLELLLGPRLLVRVRVVLARELAVRLLDLLRRRPSCRRRASCSGRARAPSPTPRRRRGRDAGRCR